MPLYLFPKHSLSCEPYLLIALDESRDGSLENELTLTSMDLELSRVEKRRRRSSLCSTSGRKNYSYYLVSRFGIEMTVLDVDIGIPKSCGQSPWMFLPSLLV